MRAVWLSLLLTLGVAGSALAHPLAPALLSLDESADGHYDVLWRTSVVRASGAELVPQWPADCSAGRVAAGVTADDAALVEQWTLACPGGLVGRRLAVSGLQRAGVNVILRLQPREGAAVQTLLDAGRSDFIVPPADAQRPVFAHYFVLGVEHLLLGIDHVLFVLGLMLLVRALRPLVITITAFTLGHSLTLSLAALGVVRVHPQLTEFAIAASILLLAVEIVRQRTASPSWLGRWPWAMAVGFGLLHGLGFAGVLAGIGLPVDEIPQALLAFNLGIEAGQLALIGGVLLVRAALQGAHARLPAMAPRLAAAYGIGTLAAYWCWDRGFELLM